MINWIKHKKVTAVIVALMLILAAIPLSAGLLAARRAGGAALPGGAPAGAALAGATAHTRTGIGPAGSISLSGTVQSAHTQNVYANVDFLVEEVLVRAGDEVAAGDLLARLDTEVLELEIAQQKARMRHNSGMDAELHNAGLALSTAELDMRHKAAIFEENKVLFESGYISGFEMEQSRTDHLLAQATYNWAVTSLDATRNRIKQENEIQQINLQRLEKELADSLIEAPLNGTVTAVYAEQGSRGVFFVIKDLQNLIITAYVKEYDMGRISQGQAVTIRSDATGDALLRGEVVSIAPTSIMGATSDTFVLSPARFEVRIAVLDHDTGLKVGMHTRLEIIPENRSAS